MFYLLYPRGTRLYRVYEIMKRNDERSPVAALFCQLRFVHTFPKPGFDHLKPRNPLRVSFSTLYRMCRPVPPSLKTTVCSCAAQSVRFSLPPQGTSRMASAHGGLIIYELLYDSCGAARSRASFATSPASGSGTEGHNGYSTLQRSNFRLSLVAFGFSPKLLYTHRVGA